MDGSLSLSRARTPALRPATAVEGVVGLALLAALLGPGRASPGLAVLQLVGGGGLFIAALLAVRTRPGPDAALLGWAGVGIAAWTFVVCFAAGLAHQDTLLWADLGLGLAAAATGLWVALGAEHS